MMCDVKMMFVVRRSLMVILMASSTLGNFRLTYPHARKPDLDFIDHRSDSTEIACGVPAGI